MGRETGRKPEGSAELAAAVTRRWKTDGTKDRGRQEWQQAFGLWVMLWVYGRTYYNSSHLCFEKKKWQL